MANSKPDSGGGDLEPGLYLVATPIGNAADIGGRALKVLAAADVIAAEDTRVTGKLLAIHGIQTPQTPYHEHNAGRAGPALVKRLQRGQTVALVSDAGMPLISDPGYRLLGTCIEAGIFVTAVPGPSAGLMALILSGLPTDRFLFQGFLPPRRAARRAVLAELAEVPATLIFQESPKRLAKALADMTDVLGDRDAAVARELTKLFEEVRRGTLSGLAAEYAAEAAPKGEVVVTVAPPGPARAPAPSDIDAALKTALAGASLRDAAAQVAADLGLPRRRVYGRALELAGAKDDKDDR